jgi:hypothetical protein
MPDIDDTLRLSRGCNLTVQVSFLTATGQAESLPALSSAEFEIQATANGAATPLVTLTGGTLTAPNFVSWAVNSTALNAVPPGTYWGYATLVTAGGETLKLAEPVRVQVVNT